jgi:hypothetical protein
MTVLKHKSASFNAVSKGTLIDSNEANVESSLDDMDFEEPCAASKLPQSSAPVSLSGTRGRNPPPKPKKPA